MADNFETAFLTVILAGIFILIFQGIRLYNNQYRPIRDVLLEYHQLMTTFNAACTGLVAALEEVSNNCIDSNPHRIYRVIAAADQPTKSLVAAYRAIRSFNITYSNRIKTNVGLFDTTYCHDTYHQIMDVKYTAVMQQANRCMVGILPYPTIALPPGSE